MSVPRLNFAPNATRVRPVASTIWITRAPQVIRDGSGVKRHYNYRDSRPVNYRLGHFGMTWHGQKQGKQDKHVGVGTGVFFREMPNTPFKWLGVISCKRVRCRGDAENNVPTKYTIGISKDSKTGLCFPLLASDVKGPGCYKYAAQRAMGYSKSYSFLAGILTH